MTGRLACVRSRDSIDCGPAALATIARHYGLFVSPGALRDRLGTDLGGTSLPSLRAVAEEIGFSASCGKVRSNMLDEIPLPAIAHFVDPPVGHLVVVHRISPDWITIADPAKGIVKLRRKEFLARWSSHLVLLAPSSDFCRSQPLRGPVAELISIARRERKGIALSLLLAVVTVSLGFTMSLFTQRILDVVVPHSDVHLLSLLSAGALLIVGFRLLGGVLRQWLLARMGYRLQISLCLPYMRHVLSLPLEFFDKRRAGDIYARTNDVSQICGAIVGPLVSALPDLFFLVLAAVVLLWYNVPLTLTILCFVPLLITAVLVFLRPLARNEREIKEHTSEWANRFIESLHNIKTLKAFLNEDLAHDRAREPYLKVQEHIRERVTLSEILGMICAFLTSCAALVLLFIGTRLALQGQLTTGKLMFFYSITGLFLGAVDRLSPSITSVQEAMIAIERLNEINSVASEQRLEPTRRLPPSAAGAVEFRSVNFGYRPGTRVISDVNLKISAGEWIAMIGETGSGKTTLSNLILGLYLPREGDILIDGISVRELQPSALRRHVAVVFQEAGLMSGTVRDNLMMGNPEASVEEMEEACKLACIHEFITDLPKKYDQNVGPFGGLLSGGQRQRVAIARALLRDAPILILDEATSHLDICTERQLLKNIKEIRQTRTTILITHRVPTALLADTIVVLGRGAIIEKGTHDELARACGKYQSLWRAMGSAHFQSSPGEELSVHSIAEGSLAAGAKF